MTHALAHPVPATTPPIRDRMLRLIVVGAGGRGSAYAAYAASTGRAEIVAVAEPDPRRAAEARDRHPDAVSFDDWQSLAEDPPAADAVIIATQDAHHVEPAVHFAELGYHILLEKPMATSERGTRLITDAVRRAGVMLAVCHVLRYTPYTSAVKRIVDSGRLGDVVSVEHLEPVGWWHQATRTSAATGAARTSPVPCCSPSPRTTWTGSPSSSASPYGRSPPSAA
ncbi:Gfo/Idh/MocA family protein [Streptomyces exfoliatus]|uniref:Gfo/Idh/MocA family protein n=1 Tax=Streptomyces exfoliatus TaxID=1905 RepID=UPI003C2E3428